MQVLKEDFVVIHAYNKFPGIGWRRCNSKGEWEEFQIE
jgi:hypothetical protein